MCGRFVLFSDLKHIQLAFDLADTDVKLEPSYNIAPTHQVATVVQRAGSKSLELMRWGLIPAWAKDDKIGAKLINARAETVAEKPSFNRALVKRRCLVVADGFYEWRKEGTRKTPMFIRLKSGELLGFAGLYETWQSPAGETLTSCAIITTAANELMQSIHERMPAILSKRDQRAWLDPANQDVSKLVALLKPSPAELQAYEVAPLVNSSRNNSAECIRAV